ncbi:MAG: P-II family nitrogen regulator [Ruminococcaceae bacterium]|nr:P-II family nitrogen regulator [Oscillospiraceae bacterium]
MKDFYCLITIARRSDAELYERFYTERGVGVLYALNCNGTAHKRTLDLLGIDRTEKTMLITITGGNSLKKLKYELTTEMMIDLPDKGVAMAIPLASIGGVHTLEYFTDEEVNNEKETEIMHSDYELIIAIYEKGFTDMVMDAARSAGAGGGTTVRARGTGAKAAEKFLGISLAEEKEIVFIVSDVQKKKDIMRAIMHDAGVSTEAHALVFSLPVSETAGFRFADTVEKEAEQQ